MNYLIDLMYVIYGDKITVSKENNIMKNNCSICDYCRWIKTKEYDCCDVQLYKCDKSGEIMDEFHIERRVCRGFNAQDWGSD